jgi:hypothetical protein
MAGKTNIGIRRKKRWPKAAIDPKEERTRRIPGGGGFTCRSRLIWLSKTLCPVILPR